MARDHDHEPTPIRGASQSRTDLDAAALDQLQAEVARRVRAAALTWAARIATYFGLPLASAGTTYYATRSPEHVETPVEREQPASGPEPKPAECQPSADLIDAQERASRDARNAIDACDAMAAELKRARKEAP